MCLPYLFLTKRHQTTRGYTIVYIGCELTKQNLTKLSNRWSWIGIINRICRVTHIVVEADVAIVMGVVLIGNFLFVFSWARVFRRVSGGSQRVSRLLFAIAVGELLHLNHARFIIAISKNWDSRENKNNRTSVLCWLDRAAVRSWVQYSWSFATCRTSLSYPTGLIVNTSRMRTLSITSLQSKSIHFRK